MNHYQHVLLATDFSPEATQVAVRAREIAQRNGARLTLVHVIEEVNISAGYELMPLLPELPDEAIAREAQQGLERMATELGLPEAGRRIVTAISTKEGIVQAARDLQADLIVVGSHSRHGLALLLGSTANAVLHGAPCDVLAVRIIEKP